MLKITALLFVCGLALTTLLLAVWIQHFSLTTTEWDVLLPFAFLIGTATVCAGVAMLVLGVLRLLSNPSETAWTWTSSYSRARTRST
jgi:hypothetical protein